MTISKVIKQKRIEKQLTQEDLAEMLLVSKKTISNWENGRTIPDTENLIQSGFFYFSHSIATWLLIFFLSLLLIINTLIIIFNKHRNLFLHSIFPIVLLIFLYFI
jgi:transcriptional regulator with XRE-family HTH domain